MQEVGAVSLIRTRLLCAGKRWDHAANRSVNGGEFLQGFDVLEFRHCTPSSPKRLVRILGTLVEPAPVRIRMVLYPPPPDLRSKHRNKPVPPETDCFVADINATFEQQVFDLAQRQRIADIHHHREADHLRRTVETAEEILHPWRVWKSPSRLNSIYSDNALARHTLFGDQWGGVAGGGRGIRTLDRALRPITV